MPDNIEPIGSEAPTGISRRTVTKAMAWAVPVIAVSAAVPAYAASQITFSLEGTGCKLPGNSNSTFKGYAFLIIVCTNVDIVVDITSITLDGNSLGSTALVNLTTGTLDTDPFNIPGSPTCFEAALLTANAPNSQNGALVVNYTIDGVAQPPATATIPSAPPINGASCDTFDDDQKEILANLLLASWAPNTAYAVNDSVILSGGQVLTVTIAGTSGGTEPVVPPPAVGGTLVDGTVTWVRNS